MICKHTHIGCTVGCPCAEEQPGLLRRRRHTGGRGRLLHEQLGVAGELVPALLLLTELLLDLVDLLRQHVVVLLLVQNRTSMNVVSKTGLQIQQCYSRYRIGQA